MSAETEEWLNTMTLIGHTAKRGTAWHYRAAAQGDESNHYVGSVPVEDVYRRLFSWKPATRRVAVEVPATIETMTHLDVDGRPVRWEVQDNRQAITRDDTDATLGIFSTSYRPHEYRQWLVQNVETLLDSGLDIGSAGLLRGGAQAWVQVEMPETIEGPGGVKHRPFITAATSLDGSLASTYMTGSQVVVCDNTLSAALGATDALKVRVRHSANSLTRVGKVRDALGLVHRIAEAFDAQVQALIEQEITDKQWAAIVEMLASTTDNVGKPKTGRALTLATTKQAQLKQLWNHDERVKPWAGNMFGVVQAVNTWEHHMQTVKGTGRAERNMARMVTNEWSKVDQRTVDLTLRVLTRA